jgi:hypothetical protein
MTNTHDTDLRVVLTFNSSATEAEKVQITRMLADAFMEVLDNEMRFTQLGDMLQDYTVKRIRA